MNDPLNGNNDEMSFEEMLDAYDTEIGDDLATGDRVEGEIISIGETSVYLATGTKSDGVVSKAELLDKNGEFSLQVGDKVKLYVVSITESEVILSKAMSGDGQDAMVEDAYRSRTPVEGKVSENIKGGFRVDIMGKRAFCPVSQMDIKYVENPEDYLGQVLHFLITRFEEKGRNIVVSRRDLLNEQIKEERNLFFSKNTEGDIVQGKVTKLMPFGAFIELIPGVEGLAHISELSWSRVEKPEEILRTGDTINVKLLKVETKDGKDAPKISLSLKQVSSNPWDSIVKDLKAGDQMSGKVVRLASFGAFVEIAPGVDGLVHLSEMSHTRRVVKADDVVQQGEIIQVVIKGVDLENKRISLSIKDAQGDPWVGASTKYKKGTLVEGTFDKKEKFGIFITLEPGVTGLMPSSMIRDSSNPSVFDKTKPGDLIHAMVNQVDEDQRKITLSPPDQKDAQNWKQFADTKKDSIGTMEGLFKEALEKKK